MGDNAVLWECFLINISIFNEKNTNLTYLFFIHIRKFQKQLIYLNSQYVHIYLSTCITVSNYHQNTIPFLSLFTTKKKIHQEQKIS